MTRIIKFLFIASLCLASGSAAGASVHTHRFWGPMFALPAPVRAKFACIMWRESRSTFQHLNLGDNNRYGSSGIFQIEPSTWVPYATALGIHVPVWRATPYQQELVAIAIYKADGFGPWASYDGC